MTKCPHCKGTGEAPIKLQQECIVCQRKLTLTFTDWADMPKDGRVYCRDCEPSESEQPL